MDETYKINLGTFCDFLNEEWLEPLNLSQYKLAKDLEISASFLSKILKGKNKAEYVPHQEIGDYVIIINAAKAKVTGNKMTDKFYYRHSMYPGGLKAEPYGKMVARKPTFPMEHAVKGMLPNNRLGRKLFTNVKIYAGAEHPHMAQQPVAIEI